MRREVTTMYIRKKQSLWYKRYSEEVERMTKYYERLNAENAKTNTIVSIATPEEMKMYEERRNKTDCHRLKRR